MKARVVHDDHLAWSQMWQYHDEQPPLKHEPATCTSQPNPCSTHVNAAHQLQFPMKPKLHGSMPSLAIAQRKLKRDPCPLTAPASVALCPLGA